MKILIRKLHQRVAWGLNMSNLSGLSKFVQNKSQQEGSRGAKNPNPPIKI